MTPVEQNSAAAVPTAHDGVVEAALTRPKVVEATEIQAGTNFVVRNAPLELAKSTAGNVVRSNMVQRERGGLPYKLSTHPPQCLQATRV